MIVKVYAGDGRWRLFEADRVEFLGAGSLIALEAADEELPDWWRHDDRFPSNSDQQHVILVGEPRRTNGSDEESREFWLVRWVTWFDPETAPRVDCHLLVTNQPVYLCNAHGDTVERLR